MKNSILEQELIYEGPIYKLTKNKVTFEDESIGRRDIVHLKGACCTIPFLDDETVLMVCQYRHAVGQYLYEFPAGIIDENEQLIDCAKRELQEETGYKCSHIAPLMSFYTTPGLVQETIHLFVAAGLTPCQQHLDADEFLSVKKVSIHDLQLMIQAGAIKDGKTILAYLLWKEKITRR